MKRGYFIIETCYCYIEILSFRKRKSSDSTLKMSVNDVFIDIFVAKKCSTYAKIIKM